MVGSSIDNWHRVDDVLYRCGQPDDFATVGLGDHPKGTGTVVDLTVPV